MNYALVILATVLLAGQFSCTKVYQLSEGASLPSGLRFNALTGLVSALIMWGLSGFRLEGSGFSLVMAMGMALCGTVYTVLGFQILELGGMALYSTFLMSGGMLLPYVYGCLFLEEKVTLLGVLGTLVVLTAIILSNFAKQKLSKKLLLLCLAVFVMNGAVSIISKCHQISSVYTPVSSANFVVYTSIAKLVFSAMALLLYGRRGTVLLQQRHRSLGAVAGASIFSAASYLLQLIGAKALPASVIYPIITGGSIVFSAVAGRLLFKERLSLRQVICILLCIVGAVLLV